jgi:hypothetical protein
MHSDIGALLVEGGVISEQQLQHALTTAVQYGGTLIQNLIRLEYLGDDELASFLSSKLKLPMAEKTQFDNLPAFITRLVPNDTVVAHRLIPIMLHQGVLHVAMVDPTDRAALEEIAFASGYKASPVVARLALVEEAMARYYGVPPEDRKLPTEAFSLRPPPEPDEEESQPPAPEPEEQPPTAFSQTLDTLPAESDEEPPPPEPEDEQPKPAGLEQAHTRLEVVEKAEDELEELFFGLGGEDRGVVHLTRRKGEEEQKSGTITDAIRDQAGVEPPAEDKQPGSVLENILFKAREEAETKRIDKEVDSIVDEQISAREPAEEKPPEEPPPEEPREEPIPEPEPEPAPEFTPLAHAEEARILIGEAKDRDQVAHILVRFALSFMPRVALFIVKKDIVVGWMGAGEGVSNRQIKGIMIPLNSPSVFRTVRETGTDYFGSLPKTTINDVFIAAMGDVRPRQVLLVPVTVRHKPICILYGDSGTSPGFAKDLSPVHLILTDASQTFERMILQAKVSRRVVK